MKKSDHCPQCRRALSATNATRASLIYDHGSYFHRSCHLRHTGVFDTLLTALQSMGYPDVDPNTAMADLIGDLGHFCAEFNKGKRVVQCIDFDTAAKRGISYFQEER